MTNRRHLLVVGLVILAMCSVLQADPSWPADGDWIPIMVNGLPYADAPVTPPDIVAAAPSPAQMNLVGGLDGASDPEFFPTAFVYVSADDIMFRMRVDGDPGIVGTSNSVWMVFLNTEGDDNTDWVLAFDDTPPPVNRSVKLIPATSGGPSQGNPWNPVVLVPPPAAAVSPTSTWARFADATAFDGSMFNATGDFFVDLAFPIASFLTETELADDFELGMAFATSTNHENINKDLPDSGWGSVGIIIVPEPTVMLILAGSLPWLLRRRRQRI
jgi:hypothetical protein